MATYNLSELFAQKIFRIPDYQRGYAWEERQLNELWDDIEEILPCGDQEYHKHYTGTIFLEKICKDAIKSEEKWLSEYTFYNVVDGQQRLTSIVILIYELLNREHNGYAQRGKDKLFEQFIAETNLSGSSKVYKFGYCNDNNDFLLHKIFEDQSVVTKTEFDNVYTKNLEYAKQFFRNKLAQLSKGERGLVC